jgi:tetratricopeptide (TPR) repeat protein
MPEWGRRCSIWTGERGVHILRRKATDELHASAEQLRRQERFEEAAADYRAVLRIDPEHAPAQTGLGLTLFAMQRYEEAMHALERVIALQPDLPAAGSLHRFMGRAAEELERPAAAAEHYERALQIDANDLETMDRLAMLRFGQRRYEQALGLYRRMAEIEPGAALEQIRRAAREQGP